MTPRAWAWVGAVCVALLAGGTFAVRFMARPPKAAAAAETPPEPAPSLLDRAMGMADAPPKAAGAALSGRVEDGNGRPVAGARVFLATAERARPPLQPCAGPGPCAQSLEALSPPQLMASLHARPAVGEADDAVATDLEGAYAFAPRRGGPWVVWVDEPAGAAAEELPDSPAGSGRLLVLHPPTRAAGEVVDESEAPVAGAHVHLVSDLPRQEVVAELGSDGRFLLEGPGEDVVLLVDAPGYAPRLYTAVGESMQVMLRREVRCRVKVTRAGRPVTARVRVQVESEDWPEALHEAPGGAVELRGLPASAELTLVAEDEAGRSPPHAVRASPDGCEVALGLP